MRTSGCSVELRSSPRAAEIGAFRNCLSFESTSADYSSTALLSSELLSSLNRLAVVCSSSERGSTAEDGSFPLLERSCNKLSVL